MKKFILLFLCVSFCLLLFSCKKQIKMDSVAQKTVPSALTTSVTHFKTANDYTTEPSADEPYAAGSSVTRTTRPSATKAATTTAVNARTVWVTIPEGYSVSQIGDRLQANGVCKKSEFIKMVNAYEFDLSRYSLLRKLPSTKNRPFRLEGYLFPAKYEFYTDMKPQDAIGKMLRGAEANIGGKYEYSEMSTDEIIRLASIIEREAAKYEDMRKVSSVFHNRLKVSKKLEADSTIVYIESFVKPLITGDKDRYNKLYNTYKCAALPEGAICSPGANALNAAVDPADTDYLYFVSDKQGRFYFAVTYEEHKKNLIKAGYATATTATETTS